MVVPSAAQNIDPSDSTARLKSDLSNRFNRIGELVWKIPPDGP